jgi:hypothetical protein
MHVGEEFKSIGSNRDDLQQLFATEESATLFWVQWLDKCKQP